jgi:hypothetical protein
VVQRRKGSEFPVMGYKRRLFTKQIWDDGQKAVNIERQVRRELERLEEKDL